jgi:hypothetical protein
MAGVEILASEPIYNAALPDFVVFLGLFCMLTCGVLAILFYCDFEPMAGTICAIIAIMGAITFFYGMFGGSTNVDYIEYKVTIDDSVSMNDFLDKYEILDQEGKIYTVKERE